MLTHAWFMVVLLWPVALLNYLDRQMISTMRESIRADLPTIQSDQDFSLLMAVFMWVYAFLSPIGGFIADRFNRRWTIILSLLVWSAVTLATGFAETLNEMIFFRALMGISEAFYIPAALALIADFHPEETRARAIGLHQTGIYAGLALGGFGGLIAETSSWRNAFYWFGGVGIAYSLILMRALRDAPPIDSTSSSGIRVSLGEALKILWGRWRFWILVLYFTLPAIAGWAMKNWLPTHLGDTYGLKQGLAGISATMYITLASLVGVILGGILADAWMKRTPRGRIYTSALGTALCVPALLGLAWGSSLEVAILWTILFGLGWGLFDCNNMPILCQITRPAYRATGYGCMNLVSISIGAGATVILGRMRDEGIAFSVAFVCCAAVNLVSVGLVLLIGIRGKDFHK